MATVLEQLVQLATVDLFAEAKDLATFVGRPFYFDYSKIKILVNDAWKQRVGGIPAGAFLLANYDDENEQPEMVLLRVLGPTALPTDSDVIAAMVDYYKENAPTERPTSRLDSYTRYEFQFSGIECRVLGSFYRAAGGTPVYAADIDNFYSPNNYSVYKPQGRVLEYIVNFREGEGIPGGNGDLRIGEVRYSSSRHHPVGSPVPVFVSAIDFLGKRTALFGMTRTGKSNTLKKIVEATARIDEQGIEISGQPVQPVGQIIFDVNGEYANDNQQDEGTAIYQLFAGRVIRYSILEKPGFQVLKTNFYAEVTQGMELIRSFLAADASIYTQAFLSADLEEGDPTDFANRTRSARRRACYQCVLATAGFEIPPGFTVRFPGNATVNTWSGVDPNQTGGVSLEDATAWFTEVYGRLDSDPFFQGNRDWADEDLKSLMRFLTRKSSPSAATANEAGFRKLIPFRQYHTRTATTSFLADIITALRRGRIVIIDLSQGDDQIQRTFSDRLCQGVFQDALGRFIRNERVNFVQMCFEEAHNLFPKRDDPTLSVYNRIAKEGAKLGLGLIYATQEVSAIASNVLKNTQNWFVSHLNNQDELREIGKYYDFDDFTESLRQSTDKGFIRMKTYSNSFIVPVQIDRFTAQPTLQGQPKPEPAD